jgi:hypothetical protein
MLLTEGISFLLLQPNTRVVINHAASTRNLAVEYKYWFPTYFGMVCTLLDYYPTDAL